MLYCALTFLVVGLIAGTLSLAGIAAGAGQIAWGLYLTGIILMVIYLVRERRVPPTL